ncbi:hypothetical protein ScPMuIL_009585 [Solemya velum]
MDPRQQVYFQGQQNVYYPGPSHQGQPPYNGQHQYGYTPQGQMYPPPQGNMYSPPQGQMYSPPQGQMYPPPQGQMYPPPQGQMYPPPQGQMNPPPQKPPVAAPQPVKQRKEQVYLQGQQNVYYPGPSHQGQQPYTHPSYIGQHQYGNMYPPSQGQMYPQPQGQMYPPPQGQMYPPPQGQMYHPPQGQMNPPPQGQMNPPPQGQMNLPPQGQMNPQPQGQMNPPPQKPPEATPKPVKQRTERTIETGGLEVQAATGNTVHDPPDGGKRAWLIVLACFFINMCNAIIQQLFMLSKDSMNDDLKDAKVAKMTEVYGDMRAISAPIGAIIAVKFGYRILTIVGGILMIFGFFIASFLDNDSIDGIGFLVAGFGGIGGAFWSLAAIVAVLEYFKTKRIRALLAANCGSVVGALIMMLIFVFGEVKLEWQKTFKAVLAPAGIGIIAGATLVPLKLIMADDSGQTFLARTLGIFSWKLFKKPALFLVMIIFFLENFGEF